MTESIGHDRRQFLRKAAMTIVGGHLGIFGNLASADGATRELAAIGRAPEWINSPPLTSDMLAGKVVAVGFWTYTCINWLRTLPYVRAWARKYGQQLVTIGVHTPEFPFERNIENVRRAVQQLKVDYPVVIDNDYSIWRAFDNNYWPALYLMDSRGRVRQHRFGEGDYQESETTVQRLLAEVGGGRIDQSPVSVEGSGLEAAADWRDLKSPETYVGYDRTQNFSSPGGSQLDRRRMYSAPKRLSLNQWALIGEWTMGHHATVLNTPGGRIQYRFHARDVHLVMSPPRQTTSVRFRVSIDGQVPGAAHGLDVDSDGNGTLAEPRLYQLIRQPTPIVDRLVEIEFLDSGAEAFSFTFG